MIKKHANESISDYKRELIYRRARGNLCKNEYINKIQSFTNNSVKRDDFINLEETDNIINSLIHKKIVSENEIEINNYKQLVKFIREKIENCSCYLLIDREWKFCGAYKLNDRVSDYYDFNKLCSDEIRIISCDLSFEIHIDYDESNESYGDNSLECKYILRE